MTSFRIYRYVLALALLTAVWTHAAERPHVLTLQEATALAIENHPRLRAARSDMEARAGDVDQARRRPNPELDFTIEGFGGRGVYSGMDSAELTASMAQPFELGRKRARRAAVAEREYELSSWDVQATYRAVRAETQRAFYDALAAREQLTLAMALAEAAEQFVGDVDRRISAGRSSELERHKADIERAQRRTAVSQARYRLDTAVTALAISIGEEPGDIGEIEGSLYETVDPPAITDLITELSETPDLARSDAAIRLHEAIADREDAARFPNINAGVGVRRYEEDREHAWVAHIAVPLPIFDANQGARRAARHDLEAAEARRHEAEANARLHLNEAYRDMMTAHAAVTAGHDIVTAAESSLQIARDGYLQGRFSHLDVLDALRALFEIKTKYLDDLNNWHQARFELERLIGIDHFPPPNSQHTLTKEN